MTNFVAIRDGGKTNEEGAMRIFAQIGGTTKEGVIGSGHLQVTENGTPDMSVLIAIGDAVLEYLNHCYHGFTDATDNPTITSNSSGNPRIDAVVAWVDLSVVSSAANNNPGAFKFSVIAGTPAASPSAPNDAAVQSAIGAGNPFVRLAHVTVADGATSIVNANISDQRPFFGFSNLNFVLANNSPLQGRDNASVIQSMLKINTNDILEIGDPDLDGTIFHNAINLPEAGMINGEIVTSVATSDLTIAIKNLAGNDPSASDPVWVRVGNTFRKITSALSVTLNDATNWFNAGSAELATKEIDYFVYLAWNASGSAVRLGASRMSHGRVYSDFSSTNTSERYFSNSGTINATDEVENVGRFNAVLSAGAAYTWSIPATPVIVNRPIYETRTLSWAPQYSASGSMTYTSVTTTTALYKIIYDWLFGHLHADGTTGGTASNSLIASLPFTVGSHSQRGAGAGYITDGGGGLASFFYYGDSTHIYGNRTDNTNYGLGASRLMSVAFSHSI